MAAEEWDKPPFRKTTSFRLAVGFGVLFLVFGAALGAHLYFLARLREATTEVRVRQQLRREALKMLHAADQVCLGWDSTGKIDSMRRKRFEEMLQRFSRTLQGLTGANIDPPERVFLNKLARTAGDLKHVIEKGVSEPGPGRRKGDRENLSRRAGELRLDLVNLNTQIGRSFDWKTYRLEADASRIWRISQLILRAILGIAGLVVLIVLYVTHRSIIKPINRLVEETQALSRGDFTRQVELPRSAEFRMLARSFNRMAVTLESHQRQLVEAEKVATLGRLSAGIAHEINNPIAVIIGYVTTLKERIPEDSPHREALVAIEEEARECKRIVQSLLELARPSVEQQSEIIQPSEVVSEVMHLAHVLKLTPDIDIVVDVTDRKVRLPFTRGRLRQVLLNLVTNALEELQGQQDARLEIKGEIRLDQGQETEEIAGEATERSPLLVLHVIDNGAGISEEDREQLFDPFFTTKARGTGLGLSITRAIVDTYDGHIELEKPDGHGTHFVVYLPAECADG
ncbi:MAG: HAMP domain-containing protein [Planctomycetes bacterium]|nr:HAMP domain-containing protein [Planctomycetota bacterium]